ncbi:MAG: hypothetical protein U1E34_09895 [Amaricoccus sp.]
MAQRRRGWTGAAAALLLLAACAPAAPRSGPDGALTIRFKDTAEPAAFELEALGRRDRPKGAQGLWVVVPQLRRAERAEVTNLTTGATATVALFAGSVPRGEVRLSNATAELLGIGADPVRVRLTALRSEPTLLNDR